MEGSNLIISYYPSNTKRGGVCIYHKESLAVRVVNITSLTECLVVYRSPSRSTSEFKSFLFGLEDLLNNILCSKFQFTIILGDLNARSPES